MSRLRSPALLLLLAFLVPVRAAEVAYIAERLNVGLHESDSLRSTILALVPSGTELEVLSQNGGLARVKTAEGLEGWVDARYLTQEAPASRQVAGLEAELTQTADELAKARERAAELEFQLNRARERVTVMEAELLEARSAQEQPGKNESGDGAAVRELRKNLDAAMAENRRLKRRVASLEAALPEATVNSIPDAGEANAREDDSSLLSPYTGITEWKAWQLMLLFFVLLLAFAAGGYVVDWEVRRRHGGFRV